MTRAELSAFLLSALIPPSVDSHGVMNPTGADLGKYMTVHRPLTERLIEGALSGETRRPQVNGRQVTAPVSLAAVLVNAEGQALAAALDVDAGGAEAVALVLEAAHAVGLWGFAQLSESDNHAGGHVWLPCDRLTEGAFLRSLAQRLQARAGVLGECWPSKTLLRLPLQVHLQAPGGPRRLPLLLQTGELIEAADPWQALARLRAEWQPNTPAQLADADRALPAPSVKRPAPLHKSKVKPADPDSVIRWYNDTFSLEDVLSQVGVNVDRLGAYTCPWHDDKHPSLVVWTHNRTGRAVCRCYSQHSNCPAAERPYLDSFNVYELVNGLTTTEAVKRLADEYGLGRRREIQRTDHANPTPPAPDALAVHGEQVRQARAQLAEVLATARAKRGTVTVIKGTPGLGKTHYAAELANRAHAEGLTVAVVIGRRDFAEEWTRRLVAPYVWRSRVSCCECQTPADLAEWTRRGYALPHCEPWCPYARQKAERAGYQAVFQYPHLHINDGELLDGYDLVIIDESPLDALLEENSVEPADVRRLALYLMGRADPGVKLAEALGKVANAHYHKPLTGPEIVEALARYVGDVRAAVAAAQASPVGKPHPPAPAAREVDPASLPRQWWGELLQALAHDAACPDCNPLLSWGRDGDKWRVTWYARRRLIKAAVGKLAPPAVIVLDGSARDAVSRELFAPWPVEMVTIDAPPSPVVNVVQVPSVASTRRAYDDAARIDHVARAVAVVCNDLNITLDGGIAYKRAAPQLAERLGGEWLHYGGQRGVNALQDARALAIVASPTTRPDTMMRKAWALWSDAPRLDTTAERVGVGAYRYPDARLQAVADLAGPEELRQAIHRARPILSTTPTTLLVFTPWPLAPLGLAPSATIHQLPYGNSADARQALAVYAERRTAAHSGKADRGEKGSQLQDSGIFQSAKKERETVTPHIEKIENPATAPPPPISLSPWSGAGDSGLTLPPGEVHRPRPASACPMCAVDAWYYRPSPPAWVCGRCHPPAEVLTRLTAA